VPDLEDELDNLLAVPEPGVQLGEHGQVLEQPRVLVLGPVVVVRVVHPLALALVHDVRAVAADHHLQLLAV
jgi:hypothetical protein